MAHRSTNDDDKKILEIKTALEKEHGREFSWEESQKALHDLETFAHIILELMDREKILHDKLIIYPKGFHLEEQTGACVICGRHAAEENSWYDKHGIKCMPCQKALNAKIIPAGIIKNKESWYSALDMETYFNIEGALLKKCIREGLFRDRVILNDSGKIHCQLFLMRDNKGVLPPKKMLQSRIVDVERNGEQYQTQEYWYESVDVALARKLMNYKIIEILLVSLAEPVKSGRFYSKNSNPLFSYGNRNG